MDDIVKEFLVESHECPAAPAEPPMSTSMIHIIDDRALIDLRDAQELGAPDVVRETIAIFLADGALRLDLTRRAVAEADAEAIHRMSHALRGSALMLGAQRLAVACQVLETAGLEGRVEEAEHALERVVFEFALAQRALRRIAA
jgi:two-component system, sensor histidine kinase and response regulator